MWNLRRTERRRKREREIPKARRARTEASRLGRGGGQQEKVQDRGEEARKGVGNKGRERGPIWSILALGVSHFVDPSEKERARKETGGRVGRGGGSQTIFYSITA